MEILFWSLKIKKKQTNNRDWEALDDQYDKKTVRFQPKAENLPQSKYVPSQK